MNKGRTSLNDIEHGTDNNSLIALIEKKKKALENMSVATRIRRDFEIVTQAREVASWVEISEALGFKGKAGRIRQAYFYEKRRRAKKEKEVVPEKKKEILTDAKAKTQKESTPFRPEDKGKGGRIGPPKPIGRGRFEIGQDTPNDKL